MSEDAAEHVGRVEDDVVGPSRRRQARVEARVARTPPAVTRQIPKDQCLNITCYI